MRKILTLILMSCFLFGIPIQSFSDSGIQLSAIEVKPNGGEGDIGPPHENG